MKKYCTRCGKPFEAIGREVICPDCKAQAAEESKKAAVLKAKKASWAGESVPVRISGRASTFIREYGKENKLPFSAALDELLKTSEYFKKLGIKWENIVPYKSRRRDKHATEAEGKQDAQEVKQEEVKQEEVKQAAKVASKATTSKASASRAAGKAASKTSTAVKEGKKA